MGGHLPVGCGGLPALGCGQLHLWDWWARGNLWTSPYDLGLDLQDQRLTL